MFARVGTRSCSRRGACPTAARNPGPCVPRPLLLRPHRRDSSLSELAAEVLASAKMNRNTTLAPLASKVDPTSALVAEGWGMAVLTDAQWAELVPWAMPAVPTSRCRRPTCGARSRPLSAAARPGRIGGRSAPNSAGGGGRQRSPSDGRGWACGAVCSIRSISAASNSGWRSSTALRSERTPRRQGRSKKGTLRKRVSR